MINTEQLYSVFQQHPKICTDTRNIIHGSIFFALKGGNFNGNLFAKDALAKGAAYAVVDEKEYADGEAFVHVEDVLLTLQDLARYHRQQLGKAGLRVFGLTGSNGKTTTKELLARMLAKKFKTLFTEGNLNNHIGVPLTLLQLDASHQMAVIEMGANHQKEIELLSSIAEPDFGLITNVGLAHLEGFGGPEGVLIGKTELFIDLAKRNGFAFVLNDDVRIVERASALKQLTYGTNESAEVNGKLIAADPFVRFEWAAPGIALHEVKTQMAGAYNLPNLLAACAAGFHFGIDAKEIDDAISSYAPSNARSQLEVRGSNSLILDCYNANPSSMAAAIDNMAKMPAKKKILVLGDMFELGDAAAKEHQHVVNLIGEKIPDATVVLVGKLFEQTKYRYNAVKFPDANAAAEWVKKNVPENALILIKGSRGMKMEVVGEAVK
ncbi:MAG: UDP-N-acetylmuramoyl-tripeptide--D-alanyl-D-alanine ligase [Bacteroidota bacterium]|nr:UDP-N-acetylmuramoyl-tripeptide--D-alanyl-D-alanine ligase [Bacteroidota bacterium]